MINAYKEEALVEVLHNGMLKGVRQQLKTRLMNELEKDVDAAIDDTIAKMKGYVESQYDARQDRVVFNVLIKKN